MSPWKYLSIVGVNKRLKLKSSTWHRASRVAGRTQSQTEELLLQWDSARVMWCTSTGTSSLRLLGPPRHPGRSLWLWCPCQIGRPTPAPQCQDLDIFSKCFHLDWRQFLQVIPVVLNSGLHGVLHHFKGHMVDVGGDVDHSDPKKHSGEDLNDS